jgi:hypothetical protein
MYYAALARLDTVASVPKTTPSMRPVLVRFRSGYGVVSKGLAGRVMPVFPY